MLEAIIGRWRRPRPDYKKIFLGSRPVQTAPPISITLDQRYFDVVEASLALTACAGEYDSNAFDRTRLAHARVQTTCQALRDHWSKIKDNPFARNRVSEELEAELPKVGLYILDPEQRRASTERSRELIDDLR